MIFAKICWAVTLLATCFAALEFVAGTGTATGAPQQAAGAAMALAICVIPYVFTRCVEGMARPDVSPVEIRTIASPAEPSGGATSGKDNASLR